LKLEKVKQHIHALAKNGERVPRSLQLANILVSTARIEMENSAEEKCNVIKSKVQQMLDELKPFG
jgi:hypothetical protein